MAKKKKKDSIFRPWKQNPEMLEYEKREYIDSRKGDEKELEIDWERFTNKKNRANCNPVFNGIDISEPLSLINQSPYERLLIIIADAKNKTIKDYRVVAEGDFKAVNFDNVSKYLQPFADDLNKRMDYVVLCCHNHPQIKVAGLSDPDYRSMYKLMGLCNSMRLCLGDMIVVTAYDMFSQLQMDRRLKASGKENEMMLCAKYLSKEERAELDKKDPKIKYFLQNVNYNMEYILIHDDDPLDLL